MERPNSYSSLKQVITMLNQVGWDIDKVDAIVDPSYQAIFEGNHYDAIKNLKLPQLTLTDLTQQDIKELSSSFFVIKANKE
jgi:hypothetical protein